MLYQAVARRGLQTAEVAAEAKMRQRRTKECEAALDSSQPAIRTISWSLKRTEYEFFGECFSFHTTGLFMLSLVGGIYGIGGGAIIAPFIVASFHLPIHTIAGATLMGTCITSI